MELYVATFAFAVASGLVPVLSGELYLIGVVLAVGGIPEALVLAALISLGQMVAKGVLFHLARGSVNLGRRRSERIAAGLEKARSKVERWRTKPLAVTFVSGSVGLPPFYLVSLAAGILDVRFRSFLLVGLAGRLVRFAALALIAALA